VSISTRKNTEELFCDDAEAHIINGGIKADSIDHPNSCISLDSLLAAAVKAII
jgi:ribose-phosphate pyrophosphokinase